VESGTQEVCDGVAALEVLEVALVAPTLSCSDAISFDAFGMCLLLVARWSPNLSQLGRRVNRSAALTASGSPY
jgi:hypothetical protein